MKSIDILMIIHRTLLRGKRIIKFVALRAVKVIGELGIRLVNIPSGLTLFI